jgi:hypothetical protein
MNGSSQDEGYSPRTVKLDYYSGCLTFSVLRKLSRAPSNGGEAGYNTSSRMPLQAFWCFYDKY